MVRRLVILLALSMSGVLTANTYTFAAGGASAPLADAPPAQPSSGQPVEITSQRTATSRTFQQRDGSLQTTVYPAPIAWKDSTGAMQLIQNDLIPSTRSGYAVTNHANGYYSAYLPSDLSTPIHIETSAGWIEYGLQGDHGTGSVSGNTDIYSLPTGSIRYATGNLGVKESIVLSDAQSLTSYSFSLKLSAGLTAQQNTSGGIDILDSSGKTVFGFLPPSMEDSNHVRSTAVTLTLSGSTMTVSANPAWLAAPSRSYPVTIDPSVTVSGPQDCELDSGSTSNHCTFLHDGVGNNGSTIRRSLFQFSLPTIPSTAVVESADLALYQLEQDASSPAVPIGLYPITRSWTRAATWQTYDGTNAWTTPGGDYGSAVDLSATIPATNGWDHLYPTQLVQNWINGTTSNNGVLLKEPTENVINSEFFYDTEYTDSTYWPSLTITYDLAAGNPGWYTEVSGVNVATGNFSFGATDLAMPGIGLPVAFGRTYNSVKYVQYGYAGSLGSGWVSGSGADIAMVSQPDGSRTYVVGDGNTLRFAPNGTGGWITPAGIDADLVTNQDGTLTLTSRGNGSTMTFSSGGQLQTMKDASGNTLTSHYNTANPPQMTSITDTQGRTTTFTYGDSQYPSEITKVTDPTGRIWQYSYGRQDLTSVRDPAGQSVSFTHDELRGYMSIKDARANDTTVNYDSSGRVSSIVEPTSSGPHPTTTFTYNTGNTVMTDPRGKSWTYSYDALGRVTSVTDPLNHTTGITWNADNQVTQVTPPSGSANATTYTYDSLNRLTGVSSPDGTSTSASYGSSATDWTKYLPTSITDAQGNTTSYGYNDPSGTLASVTNPGGGSISCNGQTVSQCFSYNSNGTMASATDERNNTTSYSYYQCSFTGSPACTAGQSAGMPSAVQPPAPLGGNSFTYDTANRLASLTDGNRHVSTYSYDAVDRLTCRDYSASGCVGAGEYYAYGYDANGNTTTVTQGTSGAQAISSYRYDVLNQLTSELQPGGTTLTCSVNVTGSLCYTHDNAGNLLTKKDSAGTTTYAYNDDGSLSSVTDRLGKTSTFGYNQDGQLTAQNFASGVTEAMSYNPAGLLTHIGATKGSTTFTSFGYSYTNPATNKATSLLYSGTDTSGNTTSYTYDPLNELLTAVQKTGGGTQLASYNYGYDAAGNLTSQNVNGQSTTLNYNGANELTSTTGAISRTYGYDSTGAWTTRSDGMTLAHNTEGQVMSITPPGGSAIGMTYRGPGMDQRLIAGTASYQYDATGMQQISDSGTTTQLTTLPDGSLLSETVNGSTYYPIHDGNGSIVGLTDATGGTLSDQCNYDQQGNRSDPSGTHSCTQPTVPNTFWFGGIQLDANTGLYGLYDPTTGMPLAGPRPGCHDKGWLEPNQKPTVFNEDRCGEDEFGSGISCSSAYECINLEVAPAQGGVLKIYVVVESFVAALIGLNYVVTVGFAGSTGQVFHTQQFEGHPKFSHTRFGAFAYTLFTTPIANIPCNGGIDIKIDAFSEQLQAGQVEGPFSIKPVRIARRC